MYGGEYSYIFSKSRQWNVIRLTEARVFVL